MLRQQIRNFSSSASRLNVAKFTGIGRIGNDMVTTEASTGRKYIKYGLAVNGPQRDQTSWYNIVVFDERSIDFMTKYLNKGAKVYVECDMSMSTIGEGDEARKTLNLVQRDIRGVGAGGRQQTEGSS